MSATPQAAPSLSERFGDWTAAVLGAAAFLASAIHVYTVCRTNGAEQIVAILVTVSVELLALVAMLELRRGFRWTPALGLLLGIGLTVSANLATAKQNGPGWGWPESVAVAPAVLFLVVLAIVETRPARHRATVVEAPAAAPTAPRVDSPAPSAEWHRAARVGAPTTPRVEPVPHVRAEPRLALADPATDDGEEPRAEVHALPQRRPHTSPARASTPARGASARTSAHPAGKQRKVAPHIQAIIDREREAGRPHGETHARRLYAKEQAEQRGEQA